MHAFGDRTRAHRWSTMLERAAWALVGLMVVALAGLGFVVSFDRVRDTMEPFVGRELAWVIPVLVDVGILVFNLLDILLGLRDERARQRDPDGNAPEVRPLWLPYVPRTLIVATIALNVAGETDPVGWLAHIVGPAIYAVVVETLSIGLRNMVAAEGPRPRRPMDRIRLSRWLLQPISTARVRRRMLFGGGQLSLADAVELEAATNVGWIRHHAAYGTWWQCWRRFRLPREDRVQRDIQRTLLKKGLVRPGAPLILEIDGPDVQMTTTPGPAANNTDANAAQQQTPVLPSPAPARLLARPPTRRGGQAPRPEADLAAALAAAKAIEARSESLNRRALAAELRQRHAVSNEKASELLKLVKEQIANATPQERPAPPAVQTDAEPRPNPAEEVALTN